jgi:Protein of unknown function (DUF2971)
VKSTTARTIFIDWLRTVVGESPNVRKTIWHYTDSAGLLGILRANTLWATDARFLNDAAEVRYGIDLVVRAIQNLDFGRQQNSTTAFLFGLLDPDMGPLRGWLGESLRPFVTCFCSAGDLLSQWRTYGGQDEFGGYAIGFTPPGVLPAWAQTAPHPMTVRRVTYKEDAQREICERLLVPLIAYLDEAPDDRTHQDSFATELVNGIAEISTWCKHPAFSEENEWRLSYDRLPDPDPLPVLHRARRGLLVPYVELEVPGVVGAHPNALPITAVWCGPSNDPNRKATGVRSLLEAIDTYGPIEVLTSTTPARL